MGSAGLGTDWFSPSPLTIQPVRRGCRFLTHRPVLHDSFLGFIHGTAIAINFGILTFTLFVWRYLKHTQILFVQVC